jgi:hypothetical protein
LVARWEESSLCEQYGDVKKEVNCL